MTSYPTTHIYLSAATGDDRNRGMHVSDPVATVHQALDLCWRRGGDCRIWTAVGTYGTPGQIETFADQTSRVEFRTWDSTNPETELAAATGFPVVMRNEWRWDGSDLRFAGGFRFEHSSGNILFHLERGAELSVDDCQIVGTGSGACTFGANNVVQQFRCFNLRNGLPASMDYTASSAGVIVQNYYGSTLWMSSNFADNSYQMLTDTPGIGIYSVLGGEVFLSNFELTNTSTTQTGIGILGARDTTIMRASLPDPDLLEGDDESFSVQGFATGIEIQDDSVFTGRNADGITANTNGIITRWGARATWPQGQGPTGNAVNTQQLSDSEFVESVI